MPHLNGFAQPDEFQEDVKTAVIRLGWRVETVEKAQQAATAESKAAIAEVGSMRNLLWSILVGVILTLMSIVLPKLELFR